MTSFANDCQVRVTAWRNDNGSFFAVNDHRFAWNAFDKDARHVDTVLYSKVFPHNKNLLRAGARVRLSVIHENEAIGAHSALVDRRHGIRSG